ncbi:hypothetical protein NX794_09470 [Streptomyces sp. LP11]|uniref:Uncharacterized protein n=1 Tax=Streptomyces pyxinicus TaxID=2970331 RepID=A0ABT2B003_9ACTN|nr:hypothetical protein [Streptomyces sp. LP11]MCS0601455.1 hypothetical protein [Streptomyces sp. LP11]
MVALAACLLVLGSAPSAFPASRPAPGADGCIATPAAYRAAWNAREVRCVSPNLFGTTHTRGDTSVYPSGFWYAWAGSSTNLERYLELRHRYADRPAKVGVGILSYVGYPGLDDWSTPTDLAVYTLPRGVRAQVPAFETWFRLLDERFGDTGAYPLGAQRDLVYAYSRLRQGEDVVGAFQRVTGCRRADLLQGAAPSAGIGCNRSFLGALEAAGPSPYEGGDSLTCFADFQHRYTGRRDAAALRGALYQCQDAGFLNTGVGLGYNTYANPFVCRPADRQSVRERYTGREFILPNATFASLPSHVDIPLNLGTPGRRDFLHDGYC